MENQTRENRILQVLEFFAQSGWRVFALIIVILTIGDAIVEIVRAFKGK